MSDRRVDPTRQGVALPEYRAPDDVDWTGRAKPVPLAEAIAMVDAWPPDFAPFTMHQMCRALRDGLRDHDEQVATLERMWRTLLFHERGLLMRELDVAEQRLAETRIGCGNIGSDLAEAREELREAKADIQTLARFNEKEQAHSAVMWRRVEALTVAVPCAAGIKDCHAPYYRHQPCCNLRVALWPGEAFDTDHLPDSGEVHLFEPDRGKDQVRVSAGCVKLIEPTDDDSFICVPVTEEAYAAERAKVDALMDAVFGPLVEPPRYERNETLDWDFKHRYLG